MLTIPLQTDPTLRRRALSTISTHLHARTQPLTAIQALQLQKGFFFALYMHDSKSPISVQNLISLLADLTVSISSPAGAGPIGVPLTEAFWATMAREWTSIDALRMDKYLLWVRMVVRGVFGEFFHAATDGGENETSAEQMALLEKFPLSPRERKVPDGLRYHVLDVYLDELERALEQSSHEGDEEEAISEEARHRVGRLLAPVEIVAKEGLSKGVRLRAKEVVADKRLVRWRSKETVGKASVGGDGEADVQDEWGGLD
jgi:ribosomal RNA-processing protein 1